jgi:CubicO group peptidase (beta-lactamase class C family)
VTPFESLRDAASEWVGSFRIPGAAVGVYHNGTEDAAGFGVTNIEHPLEVDGTTLFQIGSITKTVTGTLAMQLVEQGDLDLDAPVQRYLPELRLADEEVAGRVTMRHLLTHTGGFFGDYFADPSRGDDALERILTEVAELPQLTPLGEIWSYCNSGFYVAGRVIEVVTGKPFESVARDRVLEPVGMARSFFFPEEVLTHRFAVGHRDEDGQTILAHPWALARAASAAGGITSTVGDLLRYARFHFGWETGTEMRGPQIDTGDPGRRMALTWFVHELDGVPFAGHDGGTNGQIARLMLAPEAEFALAILTNHSPQGNELLREVTRLACRLYLGVEEHEPEPIELSPDELTEYAGVYANPWADIELRVEEGRLVDHTTFKAGFPTKDTPPLPPPPPSPLAFYDADRVFITEGPYKGRFADFVRGADGSLAWFRTGGRLHRAAAS